MLPANMFPYLPLVTPRRVRFAHFLGLLVSGMGFAFHIQSSLSAIEVAIPTTTNEVVKHFVGTSWDLESPYAFDRL